MSEHTSKHPAVRFIVQKIIEDTIERFTPDVMECAEILDALTAALKRRYDEGEIADALFEAWQFRNALEELERTLPPSAADEALELFRAQTGE